MCPNRLECDADWYSSLQTSVELLHWDRFMYIVVLDQKEEGKARIEYIEYTESNYHQFYLISIGTKEILFKQICILKRKILSGIKVKDLKYKKCYQNR